MPRLDSAALHHRTQDQSFIHGSNHPSMAPTIHPHIRWSMCITTLLRCCRRQLGQLSDTNLPTFQHCCGNHMLVGLVRVSFLLTCHPKNMLLQRHSAQQEGAEALGQQQRKQNNTAGATLGRAECAASLALTMLLMLKRYLKATYSMSEERIAAFLPDLPDKRKQVCFLTAAALCKSDHQLLKSVSSACL